MFEAFEMIMNRLESTGDATVITFDDGTVYVTLEDFAGFDADWNEIDRQYVDAEMVDALDELLEQCEMEMDGLYDYHIIDGHRVHVSYASEDI